MDTDITTKVRVYHRLIESDDGLVQHRALNYCYRKTKPTCAPSLPGATGPHVEETTKLMTEYIRDQT